MVLRLFKKLLVKIAKFFYCNFYNFSLENNFSETFGFIILLNRKVNDFVNSNPNENGPFLRID